MKKSFYKTPHCISCIHCHVCRDYVNGLKFRMRMSEKYDTGGVINFACPMGLPFVNINGDNNDLSNLKGFNKSTLFLKAYYYLS